MPNDNQNNIDAFNNSGAGVKFTPNVGVTSTLPTAINSTNIQSSPSPLNLPTTPVQSPNINYPVVTPPTGTIVNNGIATIPTPVQTPVQPKSAYQTVLDKISGLGDILGTKSQVTQNLQEQTQLGQKTQQAAQDYNAYNQAKLDLQKGIDTINAQQGLSVEQKNQQINDLNRTANSNLANLAIQAQASQGLLSAAEKTIQDKLSAQFQPVQDQIDFYAKFAQLNANDLTDRERFQLQQQADQKKTELSNVQSTASSINKTLLDNGAPISTYSAIDKIANDFSSGKISASDAQSQMYQIASPYGINPQDAQYKKVQLQNAILSGVKTQQEIVKNNQTTTPANIQSGSKEYKIAQDLAYGTLTFQQFKSLYSYSRDVNAKTGIYDLASQLNPNFNPSQFELGYKIASNPKIRQQLASMDNVLANVPHLLDLSDQAIRTGTPLLNNLVIKGGIALGNSKYSNFHSAITAFADELSGALGFGSATDMSRQMGFDMTNAALTPDQFTSSMKDIVVPFIANKKQSLLDQMGIYGNQINNLSNQSSNNSVSSGTLSSGITYKEIK